MLPGLSQISIPTTSQECTKIPENSPQVFRETQDTFLNLSKGNSITVLYAYF